MVNIQIRPLRAGARRSDGRAKRCKRPIGGKTEQSRASFETDPDLLDRIDEMLSESSPNHDDLMDIADDVSSARRKPENEGIAGNLRRFGRSIDDYSESIEKLGKLDVDIQVFKAIEQFMALMENNEIS